MKDPASRRDIVSLGLITDLKHADRVVTVQLTPPTGDIHMYEAVAAAIRRELGTLEQFDKVVVKWPRSSTDESPEGAPAPSTVHLPIMENGVTPEMGTLDSTMNRVGLALDSGYGEGGPEQLLSPESELPQEEYEGWPPVHQWEVDPTDPTLTSDEAHVAIGDWEFEIWWQEHSAGLVYVAIQALKGDTVTDGPERQHPVGRNVVVNLVYDQRREAVIAVYGTARDFRPFIEAFRTGYGLEQQAKESNT